MKVWIVGKWKPVGWDFQGVFSAEEFARKACTHSTYFVGPATLDEQVLDATEDWPGCYYPGAMPDTDPKGSP